ncbi:MAG TPA: ABC transporter permease subunit [Anaerolineae bacterium]|nr:ABC transporter permease subunit [Anaerolineae bacterium]HQK15251.1 ABC transporter permease subunit [Anaerolineae bacterium]
MRMNIFRQEFNMRLRSVIIWSAAMLAMLFVFTSLFTAFAPDAELLNEMMSKFPEALLTAFGMNGVNLATILGYFSFIFLFVQVCLAIQAANYGFGLVSVEEREWTADFLLAKPVGRPQILTSKLLAALSGLLITDIVVWVSSFAFIQLFKGDRTYDTQTLVLLLLSIVPFQLFFLAVGLVVSLLMKRIRSVTPYAMALGFGMYFLSVFGDMLGESVLEKITPFRHFDAQYIIQHDAYDMPLVLISVAVILVSLVGSYVLYTRRNIPAVV